MISASLENMLLITFANVWRFTPFVFRFDTTENEPRQLCWTVRLASRDQGSTAAQPSGEFKDVADLGLLLYSMITRGYRELIATTGGRPPLDELELTCPKLARTIRQAWCEDSLLAIHFGKYVANLDLEMNGDSFQPAALDMTCSHFSPSQEYFSV